MVKLGNLDFISFLALDEFTKDQRRGHDIKLQPIYNKQGCFKGE